MSHPAVCSEIYLILWWNKYKMNIETVNTSFQTANWIPFYYSEDPIVYVPSAFYLTLYFSDSSA